MKFNITRKYFIKILLLIFFNLANSNIYGNSYDFEILGKVFPMAMNKNSQVVGRTSNGTAFLWDSTNGLQEIGQNLNGTNTAYEINDIGDVIGCSTLPWAIINNRFAYISNEAWRLDDNSNFIYIDSVSHYGCNKIGDKVGAVHNYNGSDYKHHVQANFNSKFILPLESEANAVNDLRQVVGWKSNPFIVSNYVSVNIARERHNRSGRVIFYSSSYHSCPEKMAFVWEKDMYLLLDGLGGPVSEACDINNNGDLVGFSTTQRKTIVNEKPQTFAYEARAVLWEKDNYMPIDLNSVVPGLSKDIFLKTALFINDTGQILCSGIRENQECVILLIPKVDH